MKTLLATLVALTASFSIHACGNGDGGGANAPTDIGFNPKLPNRPNHPGQVPDFTYPPLPSGCSATPETTEGPFYENLAPPRQDITEGKPGVPMSFKVFVEDATTCAPLAGKVVEIWHADAQGAYSDVAAEGTQGQTSLRGSQVTNSEGAVVFQSVFPGWYEGRATHVHLKVHLSETRTLTTQAFFEDSLSNQIDQTIPYNQHTGVRTLNAQDSILGTSDLSNPLFALATYANHAVAAVMKIGVAP